MTDTAMLRDVQVALDMGKKAMLGYFDIEFTVYGTAYLIDGEMNYRISKNADQIYHFIETKGAKDVYCSNLLQYTRKYKVPSGTKEDKDLMVKYQLAKNLQRAYPQALFRLLAEVAEDIRENSAYDLLKEEQEKLEGLFDEDRLRYFKELVEYSYSCLKLNKESHQTFSTWIDEEKRSMEDSYLEKDIFEKTFYGIAYHTEKGYQYEDNSLRENIYRLKYEFEQVGILTSPIFSQTYWYNYVYRLPDAKKDFTKHFKTVIDHDYLQKLEKINAINGKAGSIDCQKLILQIEQEMGQQAANTLKRYICRWRLR